MENPIKMDDFGGTPIFGNTCIYPKQLFFFFSFAHAPCQSLLRLSKASARPDVTATVGLWLLGWFLPWWLGIQQFFAEKSYGSSLGGLVT